MIDSKLPLVGTTIFTVMSALAAKHNAINLGQGFPDFPMDGRLMDLVSKAMQDNYNQYAPMPGWLPLRESIAEKVADLYNSQIDPNTEITITPGGTYAIYSALTAVLRPGDEVIVFEPAYDSYIPNIEINGAIPVRIDLRFPTYQIDWEIVRQKITKRTRMIMLNSPHNPTGAVLGKEDIDQLRQLTEGTNIIILSDEVYEHLIYDDKVHHSILRYPDLLARSFICFSFGKVYNCTGWKLGYCIAPAAFTAEFRKVHQFNCFSCFTPAQVALGTFLKQKESYQSLAPFMQQKRDYFLAQMKDSRFTFHNSSGSYFICASYEKISNESDTDFATRLTIEAGVATIPLSAFYRSGKDDKVIRFCFSKNESTLEAAARKLSSI